MIAQRDVFNLTSTQLPVGASLASVLSAHQTKAGVAVDVGLDLARFDTKTFFLKNIGANPINAARLEATNIPAEMRNSNDWELIDSTTFQFVAAGSVKSKHISGDSRRYWRLQVSSTNGATVIANVTGR
jgi:hypothetical protein